MPRTHDSGSGASLLLLLALMDAEDLGVPAHGNEIARQMQLSKGAITYAKKRLIAAKLITQDAAPKGRPVRLRLTAAGRRFIVELSRRA